MGLIDSDSFGINLAPVEAQWTAARVDNLDPLSVTRGTLLSQVTRLNAPLRPTAWETSAEQLILAGVDAYGAWSQLIQSTARESSWLWLTSPPANSQQSANRQLGLEIGVGAPGSEAVVVPDVRWSLKHRIDYYSGRWGFTLCLPLRIAAGSRVVARTRRSAAYTVTRIYVQVSLGG